MNLKIQDFKKNGLYLISILHTYTLVNNSLNFGVFFCQQWVNKGPEVV